MELHEGTISVTSEGIGKGSCFTVDLPIVSNRIKTDIDESYHSTSDKGAVDNLRGHKSSARFLPVHFPHQLRLWFESVFNIFILGCVSLFAIVPDNGKVSPGESVSCRGLPLETNHSIGVGRSRRLNNNREIVKKMDGHSVSDVAHIHETTPVRIAMYSGVNEKDDDDNLISYRKLRRVLIVDDVAMNRKMLKRLLVTRFEECDEAEDGQQAVDMVKEAMALGANYDVITMDYQMPVMDGVTASKCIRKLGFRGQIIGVTGNALLEDLNSFLASGADIIMTKPLSIELFDQHIKTLK